MGEKYKFARRPYAHQVKALRKLCANGYGGALLMQPRTGKTKVVVDFANIQHMKGNISRVLVVCPAGVMGVWPDEIKQNTDPVNGVKPTILVWDRRVRKKAKEHHRPDLDLPRYGRGTLDWVIVNYDAFSTPGAVKSVDEFGAKLRSHKRGGRYDILKKIKAWQPDLIVLDESHRIKSPSAKKASAMHQFRAITPYRIICTGTVVTKKKRIFDVYSQWKFLNPDRFKSKLNPGKPMTFGEFKSRYATFKTVNLPSGDKFSKWLGNQNEQELHRLIHLDAHSVLREDCYDLPPLTNQVIHVELEESAEVYDQMAEDLVARIKTGEYTEASIPLVQRLRLQQITSGITTTMPSPEHPEGRLVDIGAEKLRVLQDRLEDLFEAEEKIIIGALFKRDLARIEELVRSMKVPITVIKGGVKPALRSDMAKAWEKLDGPAVFLGQPGAMAEGIDLRSAAITIWYSLPQSWVNYQQFSDRNALSVAPRFAEFLLAPGVDQLIYDTLQGDGEVGKAFITSPDRLLREAGD